MPELMLNDMEAATKHYVMAGLLTHTFSGTNNEGLFALSPSELCTDCALCNIMKERRRVAHDGTTIQRDLLATLRFWARVDMLSNNLYWTASQDNGDTIYPVTR